MTMTKEDFLALKGVAIIMMVLYHLFYVSHGGICTSEVYIGSIPLLKRFSEICYPVSLYLILSGYGLYASYTNSGKTTNFIRIRKLYIHLWLIYLIVFPLAVYIDHNKYPGSLIEFFLNIFSIKTSYNSEQWFLLPYILVVLLSNILFPFIKKVKSYIVLILAVFSWFIYCFIWVNYNSIIPYLGKISLYIVSFLLPFCLGALAKKEDWIDKIIIRLNFNKNPVIKQFIILLIILLLLSFRLLVPNQSLQPFFSFILIIAFVSIKIPLLFKQILRFMGIHSLNIWLIHTWFCFYLFGDKIYGLENPFLIFAATVLVSLLVSYLVELIYLQVSKIFN